LPPANIPKARATKKIRAWKPTKENLMAKVFLYAEYQISYSFGELDLPPIHTEMKSFPGLKSETWLSGVNNNSVGGFYEFDTKKNAQNYADKCLVPYCANLRR
jgi:hypothetical protein